MNEKVEDVLADLLLRWEELRERGQETPASELCRDHPHLSDELARRIESLKVMSWMDRPLAAGDDPPGPSCPIGEPRTLLGRYRLDALVAEGGFAQVWQGYDLELQRAVAVKVPKPSRLQSAEAFTAEARRVARLKHPGIVPVFDVGREGEVCFIVSEFVEGGSLGEHLVNNRPTHGQAIRWVVEVAEALEYAHLHAVVHRDVKPGNILIDHHGRALLADFGIAQSASKAGQQALSLGTLRYMSPEQLEGKVVDPRADIFSLGVVLHEALTGRLPYSSSEPNVLRREIAAGETTVAAPDLPAGLRRICRIALHRDPQQRYTSAAHFAADLHRALDTRKSLAWLWVLLLVLFAVACGAIFWWKSRPPVPNEQGSVPTAPVSDTTKGEVKQPLPGTPEAALALGRLHFGKQEWDKAEVAFTEALKRNPDCAEAYHRRAWYAYNTGRLKESLPDFDTAARLDPTNAEVRKNRVLLYLRLMRVDEALADLTHA